MPIPRVYELPITPDKGNFMYIIKPVDAFLPKPIELKKQPTLHQLRSGVEGNIELVPYFNSLYTRSCVAFCNEDGKRLGLIPNIYAQFCWALSIGRDITEDYLVGNIVVIIADPNFLKDM
jgi:hypothetical protein